jgi:hypothetical protein
MNVLWETLQPRSLKGRTSLSFGSFRSYQMGSKPRHISAGGSFVRRIGEPWFESDEATRRRGSHREPRKLEEHATVAMAKG